ncbi:MAG: aminotransferase class I/II-fold pyridoxal phosphate-dependent enzyme, partial [Bdellovibrionales bacterium]|nr:aminotransferase class I/II-fold pyridoxal phosphate-dependent enzyme [Bdellovibrionales bacterium]
LAAAVGDRDILIIADEIYRQLVYTADFVSILEVAPQLADRVVLIDGVSKTYAMTGWRIGYACGPSEVIGAMSKLQGQMTSNACHAAQVAAEAALTQDQRCVSEMRDEYALRLELMCRLLRDTPGVALIPPQGAFYVFPDVSAHIGSTSQDGQIIGNDLDLCDYLLDHAEIAVVPGSAFGASGHLRMSYACSTREIEEGCRRLASALSQLTR